MTSLAQLRKAALALPETAEHGGEFTVCDKRFAATDQDGRVLLHLPAGDAERVLAEHPTAQRLPRIGVRVPFGDINGQQLNHWVRRAWLARAPEQLAAQVAAADTAAPGAVGDLPKGIGRPATQALVGAGITTMAQVAQLTATELLAMHGVGPKVVRILREALGADSESPLRSR